jgi:tetratricopeptide (TPR) repeat protein
MLHLDLLATTRESMRRLTLYYAGMRVGLGLLISVWIAGMVWAAQETKPAADAKPAPPAILSEADGLYRKGSFDSAIARYNDLLKAEPASGDAYAGIIRCYLKQDKVQEADDTLRKALQTVPNYPEVKVAEGELLFRQGQIAEAKELFGEVMASPPDPTQPNSKPSARAYLGAARVAAASAMYARENTLLKRALALDPSDSDIQKLWMDMQSMADRIRSLTDYLAQPSSDDEDTRRRLRERLESLKASQSVPRGRCQPASDYTGTKTTLASMSLGGPSGASASGLDVWINGKQSQLLLDTGASGITISSQIASQAGLTPVATARMSGIGDKGEVPAQLAYADSVQIADMDFHNCPLSVIERVPRGTDGVIGTDVFSQFLIELDFPASLLTLSRLPPRPGQTVSRASLKLGNDDPATETGEKRSSDSATGSGTRTAARYEDRYIAPEMHSYVQIFRIGHMLLVPTTINENISKLFLLDTGAFDNTITPVVAREVTKVHRAPRIEVHGTNGEVKKVYVASRVTIDFGHLRQEVPDMVSFDMSRASRIAGTEISGTLGIAMLHLLTVRLDYRDALADFRYTAKPPHR